jgi:hypothetical protein
MCNSKPKDTIAKTKQFQDELRKRMQIAKEAVNLKIDQYKFSSLHDQCIMYTCVEISQ